MNTCLSRRGWVRPVAEALTHQQNMCDTQYFGRVLAGVGEWRGWVRLVAEALTHQHNMCDTQYFGRVLAGVGVMVLKLFWLAVLDDDL